MQDMTTGEHKQQPRLPQVGEFVRGVGTLEKIEKIEPPPQPPPTEDWIFSEITARKEVRHGDEVLKIIGTYNDFCGKGTCVTTAIEEAKEYAARKGIKPDSDIEIVVVKNVTHNRYRPDSCNENFYDKTFVEFEEHRRSWNVPEQTETVVWSSRKP